MKNEIRYRFHTAQVANRFVSELKHWPVADVTTSLLLGGLAVKVNYQFDGPGFDSTCAELDDLAAKHGGSEIN